MDFGSAAFLTAVLLGLGQQVKSLVFGSWDQRKTTVVVLATSIITVWLVATSAWGHDNIVSGHSLDELGWSSLTLTAIMLAGFASAAWETLTAVKNFGQNQPPRGVRVGQYGEDFDLPDHTAVVDVTQYPAGHPLHVDADPRA